jgi:hypothetical protein
VDKHVVAAIIARDESEALSSLKNLIVPVAIVLSQFGLAVLPSKNRRPMIASRQTQRSGGSPTSNGEHPGSLYVALNDVAPSPRA